MSFTLSRKTYDTDSITLRRIFSYDPTNSPFSTGFVLTSLTKGIASFVSPNIMLSSIGVPNLPAQLSSIDAQILSTISSFYTNLPSSQQVFLPSTVIGLGTAGYVSTASLNSTIEGLGSIGYLSSGVFVQPLLSTVGGLGSIGYISSPQLVSTTVGLGSSILSSIEVTNLTLFSSIIGLGTLGYISSQQLVSTANTLSSLTTVSFTSTVAGLGNAGYVSTAQFISAFRSTVTGLGTTGYISTIANLGNIFVSTQFSTVRSTYSNTLVGNWSNVGFLYTNISSFGVVSTIQFDVGKGLRDRMVVSTTNLDIEFKANTQFGYYDSRSLRYDFSTCLVRGTELITSNIIGYENYSYYILNANAVNLPFFMHDRYRFIINDIPTVSSLKNDIRFSSMSLFHVFGVSTPTTNQFFASPARPTSISVVVDNSAKDNSFRVYP